MIERKLNDAIDCISHLPNRISFCDEYGLRASEGGRERERKKERERP